MAIGFFIGITKGIALGEKVRLCRPVSPMPWIMCAILSAILLLFSIGATVYTLYFISASSESVATVTDILERKDKEGSYSYSPVYIYTIQDGQSFKDKSTMSDGRIYQTGDKIPIRYLTENPFQSRIDTFEHHWFTPIFLALFSLVLAAGAIGFRWWCKKEQEWVNKRMETLCCADKSS